MSACTTDPKDVDVVEVRRYAIKYTPPTIVIEYKKNNKLYIKKIKLNISAKSDAKRIVHKLIKQNSDLLHHDKICKEQLTELVTLLIEVTNAAGTHEEKVKAKGKTSASASSSSVADTPADASTIVNGPPTINTSFDGASDVDADSADKVSFSSSGDVSEQRQRGSSSSSSSSSSGPGTVATRRGTDEDDDPLDDQEFNSLIMSLSPTNFDGLSSQTKTVMYTPAPGNSKHQGTRFTPDHHEHEREHRQQQPNGNDPDAQFRLGKVDSRGRVLDEMALLEEIDSTAGTSNSSYAVVDLNKAPQIVVDKVKEHMSLQFSSNQLKPGDEGYVYDVQKDFTIAADEQEPNDWDDDDE